MDVDVDTVVMVTNTMTNCMIDAIANTRVCCVEADVRRRESYDTLTRRSKLFPASRKCLEPSRPRSAAGCRRFEAAFVGCVGWNVTKRH